MTRLHGTIAAAVTPLRDGGTALDPEAFGPYLDHLVAGGLDGVLAFGTAGEGVLLSVRERMQGLALFRDAIAGRMLLAAHCGAQTTADTVALAAHAVETGADAVAVMGPPYFKLDPVSQLAHFEAAARACAPAPFYVYEFTATAGYPVALETLDRLRDRADNFVGLKVSNTPWEALAPYLIEGLDVFIGPEALLHRGLEAGAIGAVSALAGVFPAAVAAVVRDPSEASAAAVGALRAGLDALPRHAASKRVLAARGVPIRPDVRGPLRDLDRDEVARLEAWLATGAHGHGA